MTRSAFRVLVLVSIVTTVAFAQARRTVTSADYDRATRMLAPALNGLVIGGTVDPTWLPDGRFSYVRTTATGTENVIVDPLKKTREVVATPAAAAPVRSRRAPAAASSTAGSTRGDR